MWTTTAQHRTTASLESIWERWSDVPSWPRWDSSLNDATIDGPFREGATGTLTPEGAPAPLPYRITDVEPGRRFRDETRLGEITVVFDHRVEEEGDKTLITVTCEVHGPGADEVGPMIAADLPDSLVALAHLDM